MVAMATRGLLSVLRPRIVKICQDLYPSKPERVTRRLGEDILRDSLDQGAE
eukprot:CAMPEP_0118654066 /NCGR_PEP_ID=MMETSP0785-20121206/12172_1 /TAXON_ID=91992 /ORGANISM="Bolidomonas pacifica, Strain CCMP 1866" /LENGTH=50 /DNA_ID=CAMNT_0006546663 /DNA_START=51 /DNA_END=200 /DNA_ORIENTATION=-